MPAIIEHCERTPRWHRGPMAHILSFLLFLRTGIRALATRKLDDICNKRRCMFALRLTQCEAYRRK